LLRFFLALIVIVLVGCLDTWEQLVVSRLLDRVASLEVARQNAHEELMVELERLRGSDSRQAIEQAARELDLSLLSPERLVLLPNPVSE
jgi:hypothetical protein